MKEIQIGHIVRFKIDIRGFLATYVVVDIKDSKALLGRNHYWKTDPHIGQWQPLENLEHSNKENVHFEDNLT